VQAGTQINLT